jgi:putative oxidoreductase
MLVIGGSYRSTDLHAARPTMPAFITFGRVLFAVIFIASGASKFFDLAGTADLIAGKVVIPASLTQYTAQLEALTGMEMKQIMAIAAATIELLCGLLIALNIGAAFCAMVLVLFVIAVTLCFHDFWNQTGPDAKNNMVHALKNLSLIGGLFMIAGIGRGSRIQNAYTNV